MVGWIILAVLVGLITLVMMVPIGADLRYEDERISTHPLDDEYIS